MAAGALKLLLLSIAARAGYRIRRIDPGVDLEDSWSEQKRLLGPPVRAIMEVGAADGRDAARYASSYPEADIYAFEPVPASFARLMEHARSSPRLHGFQCAMSSRRGRARFNVARWPDASSLLVPRETGATFDTYQASVRAIEVETDTIDDFCLRHDVARIDLLKMDTQGAELLVLDGAERMLADGAIGIIYTEMLFAELYEGAALAEQVTARLREHGYRLHNLYNMRHNHRGQLCWCDALFTRAG